MVYCFCAGSYYYGQEILSLDIFAARYLHYKNQTGPLTSYALQQHKGSCV